MSSVELISMFSENLITSAHVTLDSDIQIQIQILPGTVDDGDGDDVSAHQNRLLVFSSVDELVPMSCVYPLFIY